MDNTSFQLVRYEIMAASVSMDYFEAPLNPCSVESIQEPVELPNQSRVWPVMLGCYELQEESGMRYGRLDLYSVQVPDMSKGLKPSMNLRFGKPSPALTEEETCLSGILDGKWIQNAKKKDDFFFASAHSSGTVAIHSCHPIPREEILVDDYEYQQFPLKVKLLGKSEISESSNNNVNGLCLSLNWDSTKFQESARIISTYSKGRVAIHDVTHQNNNNIQLIQRESWLAHTMFTQPAEVWSAGFVGEGEGQSSTNTVMSGGDEGSCKVWDIRSTCRPMQVLKHFDAGVTVVAPHPRKPNLIAVGSYDESICLYDTRYLSASAKPLGRSGPLGGGIWRLKWHPIDDNRLLVAAMHGGCRVVQIEKLLEENDNNKVVMVATKEFNEHKSMAYGADWLVCKHPTEEDGYFEAAASCSFYDKAVYLWDTV